MKTEDNKLITEFMGYKPTRCSRGFAWENTESLKVKDQLFPIHGRLISDDCSYLKFHKSWDWLIPVVTKIKRISNSYEFDTEEYNIFEDIFHLDYTLSEFLSGDIDSIYNRVVEFIKWYNQQNTKA